MRCQFRCLRDHAAIHIRNRKTRGRHARHAFAQQHAAVRASELRVGVREMAADIAHRGRAEQRVGDGMQQHVSV